MPGSNKCAVTCIGRFGDLNQWAMAAARFFRFADIVKASDEDIRIAFGEGIGLADAAQMFLRKGAKLVVITRGEHGAVAFAASGAEVSLPGRSVAVRDTVGAGDTFHAALLARLAQSGRLTKDAVAALDSEVLGELLRYATTAAAIACSRVGADLPRAIEIEALLNGSPSRPAG